VEKSFVADGAASGWALAVTWIEGDVPSAAGATDATVRRAEGRKVDYREVLSPAEFTVYDRLRQLRKQLAEAEGLPPYAVFTNEQLAAMVQQRVLNQQALGAIDGVGEGRIARYAAAVLAVLRDALPAGAVPQAQQAPVGPASSGGAAP
jgi:superfamily II DNA helicase RecQ